RLDLGAVERHVPELHQPSSLAQLEYLHEQPRQRRKMAPPELRDGAEVTPAAPRSPRNPPARCTPWRSGVTSKGPLHTHKAEVPPPSADDKRLPLACQDRGKIKLLGDQRHHEARKVPRRKNHAPTAAAAEPDPGSNRGMFCSCRS